MKFKELKTFSITFFKNGIEYLLLAIPMGVAIGTGDLGNAVFYCLGLVLAAISVIKWSFGELDKISFPAPDLELEAPLLIWVCEYLQVEESNIHACSFKEDYQILVQFEDGSSNSIVLTDEEMLILMKQIIDYNPSNTVQIY